MVSASGVVAPLASAQTMRIDLIGVDVGDDVVLGRGIENVHVKLEEVFVTDGRGAGKTFEPAVLEFVVHDRARVEAGATDDAAAGIGDGDKFAAAENFGMQQRGVLTGVAKALDGVGAGGSLDVEQLARLADGEDATAGERIGVTLRTAENERLAGNDRGMRAAGERLKFVHHPRHDLRRGVEIRRDDVAMAAEFGRDGTDPAADGALLF